MSAVESFRVLRHAPLARLRFSLLLASIAFAFSAPAFAQNAPQLTQPLAADLQPNPADPALLMQPGGGAVAFACPRLTRADRVRQEVYQGNDGWFFRSGDLAEDLTISPPLMAEFVRLSKALAARGTTLVLAPTPPRGQIGRVALGPVDTDTVYDPKWSDRSDSIFRADAAKAGLAVIPALSPTTPPEFFFRRDHHWTPLGSQMFAKDIAAYLGLLPAAKALPRLTFHTTQTETIDLQSHLRDQIAAECDVAIPPEQVTLYRTEQSADTAADLFGDDAAPSPEAGADALFGGGDAPAIALIGTSFSEIERYGFEGFLLQETGLQVANHAVSSGGAFASMVGYLSSPAWRDTPSPIMLWEFQRNDALLKDSALGFRQAIPAAKGDCGGGAIATAEGESGKGLVLTLAAPEKSIVSGQEAYAVIQFADPLVRVVAVSFQHRDGQIEDVPLIRHPRLSGLDTYYLELSGDIDAPLQSITVAPEFDRPVKTSIRLCAPPTATP